MSKHCYDCDKKIKLLEERSEEIKSLRSQLDEATRELSIAKMEMSCLRQYAHVADMYKKFASEQLKSLSEQVALVKSGVRELSDKSFWKVRPPDAD